MSWVTNNMNITRTEIRRRVARLEGELAHLLIVNRSPARFREALHQSVRASLIDVNTGDRAWAIDELNAALRDFQQAPLDAAELD
jgi:hypothetical protein